MWIGKGNFEEKFGFELSLYNVKVFVFQQELLDVGIQAIEAGVWFYVMEINNIVSWVYCQFKIGMSMDQVCKQCVVLYDFVQVSFL